MQTYILGEESFKRKIRKHIPLDLLKTFISNRVAEI